MEENELVNLNDENNINENVANKDEDENKNEEQINKQENLTETNNNKTPKEEDENTQNKTIEENTTEAITEKKKIVKKLKILKKNPKKSKISINLDSKIYSKYHTHNNNIINFIKEREQQEIGECSFCPEINKKIGYKRNKFYIENDNSNENVVDRLLKWNEKIKKKMIDIKKKNEETSQVGCTFIPKLNREIPKFEDTKVNGVQKYLDRMKEFHENKKENQKKQNPNYDKLFIKHCVGGRKKALDKNKKISKKEYKNYLTTFHKAIMNDDE